MKQQTLADGSFEKFCKKTRKEQFLDEMDTLIPWQHLTEAIEPYYPTPQFDATTHKLSMIADINQGFLHLSEPEFLHRSLSVNNAIRANDRNFRRKRRRMGKTIEIHTVSSTSECVVHDRVIPPLALTI